MDAPTFPLRIAGDTVTGSSSFDSYSCAPSTDEGGPEIVYRLKLPEDGFLSAAVYGDSGTVDIDVHLLADNDPNTCLSRGNVEAKADVEGGYRYVVVDSFVKGGVPQAGPFTLDIGFRAPSVGPCELETGVMPRVNDGGNSLAMPATGPIVKEAHLVTQEEPAPYPTTSTEKLSEHYALSQQRTGFVMYRKERWAPLEGGTHYGQGIGPATLVPVIDEGWYVNMYWRAAARPARGTRMILIHPDDPSRAVVVSAGHETGPGNLSHIGGTTEETHFYMGTGHLSTMKLGIAKDQSLPFGPRKCVP